MTVYDSAEYEDEVCGTILIYRRSVTSTSYAASKFGVSEWHQSRHANAEGTPFYTEDTIGRLMTRTNEPTALLAFEQYKRLKKGLYPMTPIEEYEWLSRSRAA